MIFDEKYFPRYLLLTHQIPLPLCLYFLRYWTIRVLETIVVYFVTSEILKLIIAFLSSRFST